MPIVDAPPARFADVAVRRRETVVFDDKRRSDDWREVTKVTELHPHGLGRTYRNDSQTGSEEVWGIRRSRQEGLMAVGFISPETSPMA